MSVYFFSDEDLRILKEIITQFRLQQAKGYDPFKADEAPIHQAPELYVARPRPHEPIPPRSTIETETSKIIKAGCGFCDIYQVQRVGTGTAWYAFPVEGPRPFVLNLSAFHVLDWTLLHRDKYGNWIVNIEPPILVAGCLAGSHPGRSYCGKLKLFKIYLGQWDWKYMCWHFDRTVGTGTESDAWGWAVDFRYNVPYPPAGATGLFVRRASEEFGTIYETVSLDCDAESLTGECVE